MAHAIGDTQERYLVRITAPRAGYMVSIPHPTQPGAYRRKNFVAVDSTECERLQQAIAWRDRTYQALYGTSVPPLRMFHRQQANSNTAIPGVTRVLKKNTKRRKDGTVAVYTVPCIVALICTVPGEDYARARGYKTKVYSIRKHGEEEARRLASEWRARMVEQLAGATGALSRFCCLSRENAVQQPDDTRRVQSAPTGQNSLTK